MLNILKKTSEQCVFFSLLFWNINVGIAIDEIQLEMQSKRENKGPLMNP